MVSFGKFFSALANLVFSSIDKVKKAIKKLKKLVSLQNIATSFKDFINSTTKALNNMVYFKNIPLKTFYSLILNNKWTDAFKRAGFRVLSAVDLKNISGFFKNSIHYMADRFTMLKNALFQKAPKLKAIKSMEHLETVAKTDSKMKKLLTFLKKKWKTLITFTTGVALIGTVALGIALEQHRKDISGCIVHYVSKNKKMSCKRIPLTCPEKYQTTKTIPACGSEIIETDLQKKSNCVALGESTQICVHCDSNIKDKNHIQFVGDNDHVDSDSEDVEDTPEEKDYVFSCRDATFGEAIADAVGNVLDSVIKNVTDVTSGAVNIIKLLLKYGQYAVIVVFVFLVIFLGLKLKNEFFSSNGYSQIPSNGYLN